MYIRRVIARCRYTAVYCQWLALSPRSQTGSTICADLQQDTLQCYRDNANHTLNCSQLVNKYNKCVLSKREVGAAYY